MLWHRSPRHEHATFADLSQARGERSASARRPNCHSRLARSRRPESASSNRAVFVFLESAPANRCLRRVIHSRKPPASLRAVCDRVALGRSAPHVRGEGPRRVVLRGSFPSTTSRGACRASRTRQMAGQVDETPTSRTGSEGRDRSRPLYAELPSRGRARDRGEARGHVSRDHPGRRGRHAAAPPRARGAVRSWPARSAPRG